MVTVFKKVLIDLAGISVCNDIRACLKIHSWHLHAPLRGIFGPNSGYIVHYAPFIWPKSPTKRNAQLPESNFQTRSRENATDNAIIDVIMTMNENDFTLEQIAVATKKSVEEVQATIKKRELVLA